MISLKIWLITDTHFCHNSLVVKKLRPANFQDMIIDNWNEYIRPSDLVIHLGDVGLNKSDETSDIMRRLPGRKILVMGNHDKRSSNWYMNNGFEFACNEFNFRNMIFSHSPVSYRTDAQLNIHGHLHDNIGRLSGYIPKKGNFNRLVSLEIEEYYPILLDDFLSVSKNPRYYLDYNRQEALDYYSRNGN